MPEFVYDDAGYSGNTVGVIAIGWGYTGDLSKADFATTQDLTKLVGKAHLHNSASNHANGGASLWSFYHDVAVGDAVIVKVNGPAIAMQVTGDYYFVADEYPHYENRRKASVLAADPDALWKFGGGMRPGENIRRTIVRCANDISADELQLKVEAGFEAIEARMELFGINDV